MLMVPAEILNEIQACGRMVNPELSHLFSMSQESITEEHNELVSKMIEKGYARAVALAYLDVMPLMVERRAISAYLSASGREDLRPALPNLETPQEAAIVGTMDRNLSPEQTASLLRLLERVYR